MLCVVLINSLQPSWELSPHPGPSQLGSEIDLNYLLTPETWELLSTLHQTLWASFAKLPATILASLSLPTFVPQMKILRQLYYFRTCQIAQLLGTESLPQPYQLAYISQPPMMAEATGSSFPKI